MSVPGIIFVSGKH